MLCNQCRKFRLKNKRSYLIRCILNEFLKIIITFEMICNTFICNVILAKLVSQIFSISIDIHSYFPFNQNHDKICWIIDVYPFIVFNLLLSGLSQ